MVTVITANPGSSIVRGDILLVPNPETRWWVKLWYRLTFREVPLRMEKYVISDAGKTTLTVKKRQK